ncbi:MAG TPA: hypothetical protein VEI82_05660 [Myxococcota bacterium]|nr:hypothetical protein [Myxococcota bacterium]
MRRVLVTHVESPVGRRVVKALFHDPEVALVVGLGTRPEPSFLLPYRGKVAYQRIDLAKSRHLQSFLHSERFARVRPDSLIHLPFAVEHSLERVPGGVPSLVSETRRLVEESVEQRCIERFVYLSSVFVYDPVPGNGNVVSEGQGLGFDGEGDALVRAWIDADLVCQGELHGSNLKMTILRAATIVTETGEYLNSPPLSHVDAPLGYDPMLAVVSDRDVARALVLALHADRPGVYNIAGREVFPRSQLGPSASRSTLSLGLAWLERLVRRAPAPGQAFDRYGLVPSARLAHEALGFEPQYRIEVRGQGAARRIDTVRCR